MRSQGRTEGLSLSQPKPWPLSLLPPPSPLLLVSQITEVWSMWRSVSHLRHSVPFSLLSGSDSGRGSTGSFLIKVDLTVTPISLYTIIIGGGTRGLASGHCCQHIVSVEMNVFV